MCDRWHCFCIVFMQFHASSVVVCMLRIPEYAEISIFYLRAIVIKSQLGMHAISACSILG